MSKFKISVVIPTFNKSERLFFLLESLCIQIVDFNFCVIIIDDGSTDNTESLVNYYTDKLNIVYKKTVNGGRSSARNFGLSIVDSRFVIFCDDDMILSPNFIQKHYEENLKYDNCIIHGKIWSLPYLRFFSNPQTGELYSEVKDKVCDNSIFYNYLLDCKCIRNQEVLEKQLKMSLFEQNLSQLNNSSEFNYLLCTGGNFSAQTNLIRLVHGFDDNLDDKWGVEDLELGYRLKRYLEVEFIYCSEAYNIHITHYRKTYKEDLEYSVECFYKKYRDEKILKIKKILLG